MTVLDNDSSGATAPGGKVGPYRRDETLSSDNADLARRDSALPGLATLLDPQAALTALRTAFPGAEIERAQPTYIRYKRGTNCLVLYRVEAAGQTVLVHAKAFSGDVAAKLAKAQLKTRTPSRFGAGSAILEDIGVAVYAFPNDHSLRALRELGAPASREQLLQRLLKHRPELWSGTLHDLQYKPERRYVARLDTDAGPQAVLKFYSRAGYLAANTAARARLRSMGPLILPTIHGRSLGKNVLAFGWLPGLGLRDIVKESELDTASLSLIGAALATLHGQKAWRLAKRTRESELGQLRQQVDAIDCLCPRLASLADRVVERISRRLAQLSVKHRPLHGDFNDKQVLLSEDRVTFLDLDEAVAGDPAYDLGLFIAHLERHAIAGELEPSQVARLAEALLHGYGDASRIPSPRRTRLYTAFGLVQLATEPFRFQEPEWPDRIEMILSRAEAIVAPLRRTTPGSAARHAPNVRRVTVIDPTGAAADPDMPVIARALDPDEVERHFERLELVPPRLQEGARLREIKVRRHKPGRRCLIEYGFWDDRAQAPRAALLGKLHARGADRVTYRLAQALFRSGFHAESGDAISIPPPLGVVPELHMWIQQKVPGVVVSEALAGSGGVALARRIAEAARKIHTADIRPHRRHDMADELRILRDRIGLVAGMRPAWRSRLRRVLDACEGLGAGLSVSVPRPIHRDFYPDQVIADGDRLYLLDFDLCCLGDPALDIGNFIGHLKEYALRRLSGPDALLAREAALAERFAELSGTRVLPSVQAYATLTLVRHIYLSTQFAERRAFTGQLLDICERRLDIAAPAGIGTTGSISAAGTRTET